MNQSLTLIYCFFCFIILLEMKYMPQKYNKKDFFQTFLFFCIFSILYQTIFPYCVHVFDFFDLIYFKEINLFNMIFATLVFDFLYYWVHRLEHRLKFLWFFHIHHHSSRYMNFFTGFRASYLQPVYILPMLLPMSLLGFSAELILLAVTFNKTYNFWIHQDYIKGHPILGVCFVTPEHHMVHHGRNPQYIDKNFGGILIIWDKIFSSFKKQDEDVLYGVSIDPKNLSLKELFMMGKK